MKDDDDDLEYSFRAVATIRTPFGEKFGTPRQPGLVPEAEGEIVFRPPFDTADAFRGLEGFSHLWLLFVFDRIGDSASPFKATVRPPRLGGEARVGVFATRSTHRPNPIGLSLVAVESVDAERGRIRVSGVDLVDRTPILDVKPYLPWVESIPTATAGFAAAAPKPLDAVEFDPGVLEALKRHDSEEASQTEALLRRMLAQDPRAAWDRKSSPQRRFAARILDFDLKWEVEGGRAHVTEIQFLPGESE